MSNPNAASQALGYTARWIDETGATWSWRLATVVLADGSVWEAEVLLCESDAWEHYGTRIRLPDGTEADQDSATFLAQLDRSAPEVYPYRYRYRGADPEEDHHIDPETLWSL